MRTEGTPTELQRRRYLAVQRIAEGYTTQEVADFLGVDPRSVRRWMATSRQHGAAGLAAQLGPGPGRPPKLTTTQEKIVLRWLSYRVVVRPALGPTRRAGVWRPLPPRLPGHVAEAARVHAARAPARAP